MSTLSCQNVKKSFASQIVLDGVSVQIAPGDRVGFVGPNGVGKTTLLRILAGIETPDDGVVRRMPPDLVVGYLPQEVMSGDGETVDGYLRRRTRVAAAEDEVDRLAADLDGGEASAQAYADALEHYTLLGGDDFEARASTVADETGLGADTLSVELARLSGGQRARAALAAILLSRFDIFLLDEPTNDLDFVGLERLEAFVASTPAGLAVVSHDRAFLERCVDRVLEFDEWTRRVTEYAGGWGEYERLRVLERERAGRAFEEYQATKRDLADRARNIRRWAEKGVAREAKNPKDIPKIALRARMNRTEKQASRVRSIERRLDRLEEVDKPYEPWRLRLQIAPERRSGEVVARLTDAVVERGAFRLGPLSIEIRWQERLALVGRNGSGKTTLLGAVVGRLPLTGGHRHVGAGVVFGEMDQSRSTYHREAPLLDVFLGGSGLDAGEARSLLAQFSLGSADVLRACSSLSPGERTRATLAELMAKGTNCLVMDEPTNHLDLPAIEELEQALRSFEGTLILVSHDRAFLDRVELDRTIELG